MKWNGKPKTEHNRKLNVDEERKTMCKRAVSTIRNEEYTIDTVRFAAELLLKEYEAKGAVPIVKILKDAGFSMFLQDLPDGVGGYIVLSEELQDRFGNDKIIVVNSNENLHRRRFTLAHEFGHYLLDSSARQVAEYYHAFEMDDNKTELEETIDRFAAELLMPFEPFRAKYEELKPNCPDSYDLFKALSDSFEVPAVAVQKRFSEVGIEL